MFDFRAWIPLGVAIAALLLAGCSGSGAPTQQEPSDGLKQIYVDNYPLKYFAERIVGGRAQVVFPAPADGDPAFWTPDETVLAAYQNADLILLNGASYAKWVPKVTLPESKLVETSAGFRDKYLVIEDAVTHSHGPEGAHAHGQTDFNTWLDPELAIRQAESVAESAGELLPEHQAELQANLASLKADLESLADSLRQIMNGYQNQPLLASHPVYNYLARFGGWNLKSLHFEPNEMPDDEQWAELDSLLAAHPARWMIWEAEPADEIVEQLKKRNIGCVIFRPCGNVPPSGDYLETMRGNLANLKPVFETP